MTDGEQEKPRLRRETSSSGERRSYACLGRFFAALLVILITTSLAVAAVVGAYFWLGFSIDTPAEIAQSQIIIATLQAENSVLQTQNNVMQTQIVDLDENETADQGTLDELEQQLVELSDMRNQLAEGQEENATALAEIQETRDDLVLMATTEADRDVLLDELTRRSARIERFLQRLSDLSGDTAADLSADSTATLSVTATLTVTQTTTPDDTDSTATPFPTFTPTVTP